MPARGNGGNNLRWGTTFTLYVIAFSNVFPKILLNSIHFAFCYFYYTKFLVCSHLNRNVNYSIEFLNLSPFWSSRQIHMILHFDLQILASLDQKC